MKRTKQEKGITLVALIITIIALLILAAVAINAVQNDGIIEYAKNARNTYEEAQKKEQDTLSIFEKYIESEGSADIWDGESKREPEKIKDGNWYIYNCEEFKFLADFVNGKLTEEEKGELEITESTTVYLMNNLDLGARQAEGKITSGTPWEPIGSSSTLSFKGTFEGNNHYIKGIYVNDSDGFGGVFGHSADNSTIKNLTIKDSYIKVNGKCVGGIVGRGAIIINCHNINTTVIQTSSYKVGGIAGQADIVENCSNTGNITGNGKEGTVTNAGGIVGVLMNGGHLYNCKNLGNITGIGEHIGGIMGGQNPNTSCVNCYNIGSIRGEGSKVGGIIGVLAGNTSGGEVKGCYNIGIVVGNEKCGSIIGMLESSSASTISYCYYKQGTCNIGIGTVSDQENIVEQMTENNMKTKVFSNKLNTATNTSAWKGNDGQYPRLNWE